MTKATRPSRTTSSRVVVRWWRDGHGYSAVNDALEYSASGTSYEDLRQHVADSAEREGWPAWALLADHARHPYESPRRDTPSGRCGACGLGPEEHVVNVGPRPRSRPTAFGRRSQD